MSIKVVFLAAVAGGLAAYLFDPTMGTVRRARLRRVARVGADGAHHRRTTSSRHRYEDTDPDKVASKSVASDDKPEGVEQSVAVVADAP